MPPAKHFDLYKVNGKHGAILYSDNIIKRLVLPVLPQEQAELVATTVNPAISRLRIGLSAGMEAFFNGDNVSFEDYEVDLSSYTDFQKSVLLATGLIAYGETSTYSEIAKRIGKFNAFRAVGNALGKNKTPVLIPCHRILGKTGLRGFAGGLEWKSFMLGLESTGVNKLKVI